MTILNNQRMVYQPLPSRPQVTLPGGAKVAVWHAPNVEHYDYIPPGQGSPQGRVPAPDLQHYMHRDSGNRTAFWRMLRVVDEFEMPSTVSLSLSILEEVPEVRDAMKERGWEVMSHGISNLRPLYGYSAEQERAFFAQNQALAERYWGTPIKGMLGPKVSGTDNTCDLMAEAGMTYHADWIHDEQPRPLRTSSGARLVSIPYSYMLNDVPLLHAKHYDGEYFVAMVKAQVTRLLEDADRDGQARVTCVATHPFVTGQPWFTSYLREIFSWLRSLDDVWITTAGEITDHFIEHHYDEQLAAATALEVTA
jgi:allantoinase